jgi:hypothetical protein
MRTERPVMKTDKKEVIEGEKSQAGNKPVLHILIGSRPLKNAKRFPLLVSFICL